MKKPLSPALLALTTAALAIPGAADAARVDYRFNDYREDPLPDDRTSSASGERYEVQSHLFRIQGEPAEALEVTADLTYETMSGATPWFILPDANGKPVQVMSGATVEDKRADGLVKATRRFDTVAASASVGYSTEDDYQAINGAVEIAVDFNDRLGTATLGVGYSDDEVEPTDGASARFPERIASASRNALSGFAGVSHVLGKEAVVQTSLTYTREDGYLSDPYKLAYVQTDTVPDSRPDGRQRLAWLTRLRLAVPGLSAALHTDYRLYSDDWEILSHTLGATWHQDLPGGFHLVPGVRWYSQSQAYFYAPYYGQARNDHLYSSDYRLSPYGALALSLGLDKAFGEFALGLRYEHYDSSGDYAAGEVEVENPGIVDFDSLSASLRYRF